MKRSARFALLAAICAATATSFAQSAFEDTRADQWATQALVELKSAGLLSGYPDGAFRGSRPATRYELAAAMHSATIAIRDRFLGIEARIDQVRREMATPKDTGAATRLKASLESLGRELAQMKALAGAIANLRRASDSFELQFEQIGVDSHLMRETLDSLAVRVGALEKRPQLKISGDANLWLGAAHSSDNLYGLNKDGRILGTTETGAVGSVAAPAPGRAGLTRDVTIAHELGLKLSGGDGKGFSWSGTIVGGNMLGGGGLFGGVPTDGFVFGNQSDVFNPTFGNAGSTGLFGYRESTGDSYIQELAATWKLGSNVMTLGRFGVSLSNMALRRLDNTSYFENGRWDNGRYAIDGVATVTPTFLGQLVVFGGRTGNITTNNGALVNPLRTGPVNGPFPDAQPATGSRLEVDRIVGGTLFKNSGGIAYQFEYVQMDGDEEVLLNPSRGANRLEVVGGSLNVGRLLSAEYYASNLRDSGAVLIPRDNDTWSIGLGYAYDTGKPLLRYRVVGANYLAPGDWGRLGVWRNPTNIESWQAELPITANSYELRLRGEWGRGRSDSYADSTLLNRDSRFEALSARLTKKLRSGNEWFLDVESTSMHDLPGLSESSRYRWVGVGGRFLFGKRDSLLIRYEVSDIRNDYQVTNQGTFRGGFLTAQWALKF